MGGIHGCLSGIRDHGGDATNLQHCNRLGLGLISFTVGKVAAGKLREVSILLWILVTPFIQRYIYLAVG
jgi:hypothetical protein